MVGRFESIFDSLSLSSACPDADSSTKLQESDIILTYRFQCLSPSEGPAAIKLYAILTREVLYLCDRLPVKFGDSKVFHQVYAMNLRWSHLHVEEIKDNKNMVLTFNIKISNKHAFIWLVTYKAELYETWVDELTHLTIRTDFSSRYSIKTRLEKNETYSLYLIVDKRTDSEFLSKRFPKMTISTEALFKPLINEIQVLTKLINTRGVEKLVEVHECKNSVHIISKWFGGKRLKDLEGKLSSVKLLNVLSQVLVTLKSIHTLGVSHEDISPENILLQDFNLLADNFVVRIVNFSKAQQHNRVAHVKSHFITLRLKMFKCSVNIYPGSNIHSKDISDTGKLMTSLLRLKVNTINKNIHINKIKGGIMPSNKTTAYIPAPSNIISQ